MDFLKKLWQSAASSPAPASSVRSDFAVRLCEKLGVNEAGKNLFLSPFSIQVALAMCAAGARGKTHQVLADLIGAPAGVDDQNRQYATLLKSINGEGDRPFQLFTANALWGQHGFRFKPDYAQAVAEFYQGAFREVDFAARPDEAAQTINAWVSEQTRARIKQLVALGDIEAARLVLTNAIYFKGRWANPFKQASTRDEDWFRPGATRSVPMMHQTGGFPYHEDSDVQALDLPYQSGRLAMLIVLPRKKDGLAALEAQWASRGSYLQVANRLHPEGIVIVSLPRFKLDAAFRLKPVLCSLGAGLAFSDDADFGGIGEEPLKISEVIHKAFVEVNEEGTEAAAATAVPVAPGCAPPRAMPEPKVFKADHPFLFAIRDRRTNAVLFSGRLLHPM